MGVDSKIESILTDKILLKCRLNGYICLGFPCVFKDIALPQSSIVWYR